eukprot:scaffold75273_cov36-Prasinocladus_malaysianus.AAC.1
MPWSSHVVAMGVMLAIFCSLLVWTATSSGVPLISSAPSCGSPLIADGFACPEAVGQQPLRGERNNHYTEESQGEEEQELLVRTTSIADEPAINLVGAWKTVNFWCLYVIVLVGCGAGLTFNNNLAQ